MPSDDLREMIAIDREHIVANVAAVTRVMLRLDEVDGAEEDLVVALASYLHSVYGGIENILKRVAADADLRVPEGERSHVGLLDSFAADAADAPPMVLEGDLRVALDGLRQFRHAFRHRYATEMSWWKLRTVAAGCPRLTADFFAVVDAMLDA